MTTTDNNFTPDVAETLLHVSHLPHVRARTSVPLVMLRMLGALTPALAAGLWFHGTGAVVLLAAGMGGAVSAHVFVNLLRRKRAVQFSELSPLVTGILLALTLPVQTPWWAAAAGAVFAILIGKEAFGGLGHNFMNPALAGRIFLQVSYPALFAAGALGAAGAAVSPEQMQDMLGTLVWGNMSGALGNASALAVLIGAVFLWFYRTIGFRIPFFFIMTTFFLFWLTSGANDFFSADALVVPCYQVLSGGLLLAALFCACDPVTSPTTPLAKMLFGMGCGVLTFLFRRWGGAESSVWFAVIIMNCATPLLDQILRPRYFGEVKRND